MAFSSRNPYTGEHYGDFPSATSEEIVHACGLAGKAQRAWAAEPLPRRSVILMHMGELLDQQTEALARIATQEMGKHIREARAEVAKCAALCRYYAEQGPAMLEDMDVNVGKQAQAHVAYLPIGVVFAVMPWNFPYWQAFRALVPALLAGNGVILKHASNVPRCALAMVDIAAQAGLPVGLFTNLFAGYADVEMILAHPAISALTLTGSEAAGSSAASLAAKHLKKQVLELGGSDPFIVLADADLKLAIAQAAASRMINTGQSCIAAKRFLVHESCYDLFTDGLVTRLATLTFGDPMDEQVNYGPLARPDLADSLEQQVRTSIQKGALAILEGRRGEGAFFYPYVLTGLLPGMPAYQEELFGPVACVYKFSTDEQAIAIANQSIYGLGSSIWSANVKLALALARQLDCGSVFINDIMRSDPRLPFGGTKRSGYGRELSSFGLHEFVNIQTVYASTSSPKL